MNCGIYSIGLALLAFLGILMVPMQTEMVFEDITESLDSSASAAVTPTPALVLVVPTTGNVSCDSYPVYCVPFAETNVDVPVRGETADTRVLDMASQGAPGVVRGVTDEGAYFLGDPAAPVRIKVFHNFGCSHCRTYANGDLGQFIESHIVTGRATLEVVIMSFGSTTYPKDAAYAAWCAGDQGAFWEMEATLFDQGQANLDQIIDFGAGLGLDAGVLSDCILSERHVGTQAIHDTLPLDYGVTGTPTVMISVNGSEWEPINRSYANLVALTEAAQDN